MPEAMENRVIALETHVSNIDKNVNSMALSVVKIESKMNSIESSVGDKIEISFGKALLAYEKKRTEENEKTDRKIASMHENCPNKGSLNKLWGLVMLLLAGVVTAGFKLFGA